MGVKIQAEKKYRKTKMKKIMKKLDVFHHNFTFVCYCVCMWYIKGNLDIEGQQISLQSSRLQTIIEVKHRASKNNIVFFLFFFCYSYCFIKIKMCVLCTVCCVLCVSVCTVSVCTVCCVCLCVLCVVCDVCVLPSLTFGY